MRQSARCAIARSANELADALDSEKDVEPVEAAEAARERLILLLERDDMNADRLERYDSGARVRVKMTRGDSPRDEDEWVIEGKGGSAEEAAAEFDETLERYTGKWASRVRALDPWGEAPEAAPDGGTKRL